VKIEFLYWEECPSHPETLARLQEVLEEDGIDAPVELIHVDTDDQAQAFKFPGSPTIRIDGADLFPVPDMVVGLSCRVYQRPDGRATPLPTKEMIRAALAAHRTRIPKGGH
jgi:hypothetical protein